MVVYPCDVGVSIGALLAGNHFHVVVDDVDAVLEDLQEVQ